VLSRNFLPVENEKNQELLVEVERNLDPFERFLSMVAEMDAIAMD